MKDMDIIFGLKARISVSNKYSQRWNDECKYCIKCNKDDIIEMCLNMDQSVLGFIINDNDYGKAFEIDKIKKYRACVSMYNEGTVIQLL